MRVNQTRRSILTCIQKMIILEAWSACTHMVRSYCRWGRVLTAVAHRVRLTVLIQYLFNMNSKYLGDVSENHRGHDLKKLKKCQLVLRLEFPPWASQTPLVTWNVTAYPTFLFKWLTSINKITLSKSSTSFWMLILNFCTHLLPTDSD